MNYYYSRKIEGTMDQLFDKLTKGLKSEGFGILSDINVKELFKKKLDIEFRPYRILGVCNPAFSNKAILAEDNVGLMLPCNILLQETGNGIVEVSTVDPVASMSAIDNNDLKEIAAQIRDNLISVVDGI